MTKIKFGTDGWRAIIAKEYTVDNVKRVAEGTAKWLKQNGKKKIVIGYDTRFGGKMFAETTARVMGAYGLKVHLSNTFVSTPMVSLGVVKTNSDLGVVITASHNPPSYNGFKLKSHFGGPSLPTDIAAVEALVPQASDINLPSLAQMIDEGLLNYVDLESIYLDHIKNNFDLAAISNANIKIAYDAMYGAGQSIMQKLFPDATLLHCDFNPSFKGQAPEPIHKNLSELSALIKNTPSIDCGIANDGDADRIGMYDADGNFVDSHHLLLLLLHYLKTYQNKTGKVVITFSVTDKMKKMSELYGLDYEVTKIGFKYIAGIMTKENVIVGGEESGGLAVSGHIPERDGVWNALLILEFMAKTGKSLQELVQEVYDIVGAFAFDRDDLHLPNEQKLAIIERCKTEPPKYMGSYQVQSIENIDGYKFYFDSERWVLIRPSGTEPVLRVYAQAPTLAETRQILEATHQTLGK